MLNKLKCFFGWHNWYWAWDGKAIELNSGPPRHAKCKICGATYWNGKNENDRAPKNGRPNVPPKPPREPRG